MKTSTRLIVASLAACLGGCATHNYKEAEATSGALRATAEEANSALASIDATMASLRDLMRTEEGDLRPRYDAFSNSLDQMGASLVALQKRASAISAVANGYLDEWDRELQQVQNGDLRTRSMERKRSIEQGLAAVENLKSQAREQGSPVLADLQDVRRVLGTDLTRGGLASVKLTVVRLERSVADLRDTSARLSNDVVALSGDLSPVESRVVVAKAVETDSAETPGPVDSADASAGIIR